MQLYSTLPAGGNDLLVFSPGDNTRASLPAMLEASGWNVHEANTCKEAVALLDKFHISVVIADGCWREFLASTLDRSEAPSVVVTTPLADESLWAEVLNLGGYDVLAQPFDSNEVARISDAAFRHATAPQLVRSASN